MNSNNQPMFKMLFRDELYTLEDVMKAAEKNPDVLWVVYEAHPDQRGSKGATRRENVGTMPASTIMTKFG